MTHRKPSYPPEITVSTRTPPPRTRKRGSWAWFWTVLAVLFVLTVSAATLVFWYTVATSGIIYLSENALYFMRNVGLIGLMIGALGLFLAIGMFRRAALPTADLLEATGRVAKGDYDIEIEERGPREIRSLAREFNEMVTQLRLRENARRRLNAAVARVLQTQFNLLQSNALSTPGEPGTMSRLDHLIRDWHTFALAESGELPLYRERTDIGAVVRSVLKSRHPDASSRGVTLRAAIPEPSPFAIVDPSRLGQTLAGLVTYAVARSSSDSAVQVEISEVRETKCLEFKVSDRGRTLTAEDLTRLFAGLGNSDSTATGLELLLARELVELHGGDITATSDAEHGTTISFFLPLK